MANFEPVDNRLVLDRKGSIAFLRDAYNSNPTGFEAALEVLGTLPATRRILITPGMIELGDRQYEENRRLARIAAGIVDLVIIVGTVNRDALVAGLHDAAYSVEKTITTHTRDEAFTILSERQRGGDLILIENDLGDLHEGVVRF
jgi:UDP-N-acetylmuramoyl-tripeptide--D-alanyl-D-alanine ligase